MTSPRDPNRDAGLWTRRQWIGAACASVALTGCERIKKLSFNRTLPLRGDLHALIWDNYISQDILDDFQAETGIRVRKHLIDSNDTLIEQLQTRRFPYDLVMPSSFMGQSLSKLGLIRTINTKRLKNLEHVDRISYNAKFDPHNHYLVPYIWGATGIGYNASRVDGLPKSWADMFAKRTRPDGTSVGVSILDDARFALGTALLFMGKVPNTASADDVRRAGEVFMKLRSQITRYESNDVAGLLARNEVDLAMAWSGDVCRALLGDSDQDIPRNESVRLSLPREGAIIFQDCFALPTPTENQAEAEEFVDYLLRPAVAARVTNYSLYATTVPASRPLVDRFILNGPSFFEHPQGRRSNFSLDAVIEIDHVYQEVWQQLRSAAVSPLAPVEVPGLQPVAPLEQAPASATAG